MTDDLFEDGGMYVEELCRFLPCSRSRAYELMRSGALPYAVLDDRRRVSRRAAIRLLATGLPDRQGKAEVST